ncbi:MAG: helix-turn-helix transcriptional regulator [Bacteroidales bacterium]|nr:helix-turn-helix transcriptional regulator [Bacteroidales bacterium]
MKKPYSTNEKDFLQKVGARIKKLRLEAGLSQEKLSFESNLDRSYIGSVERGERNIALINLNEIAVALNISISELLKIE